MLTDIPITVTNRCSDHSKTTHYVTKSRNIMDLPTCSAKLNSTFPLLLVTQSWEMEMALDTIRSCRIGGGATIESLCFQAATNCQHLERRRYWCHSHRYCDIEMLSILWVFKIWCRAFGHCILVLVYFSASHDYFQYLGSVIPFTILRHATPGLSITLMTTSNTWVVSGTPHNT